MTTGRPGLPLRVMVVDDHRLFRQGLISLMRTRPDLVRVVGEAETGPEALELAKRLRPELILMDIYMPEGDGLEAAQAIRRSMPETDIVVLTASDSDEDFRRAVGLGVAGYLLKNLDAAELFDLIQGVARGEAALTRAMAARLLKQMARPAREQEEVTEILTEREIEVLRLLARGDSNPEIAEELHITVNTVKTHISHILAKLQLDNRTQAAAYAVQRRLVSPE
jgi:DNA-binding NarL/FixJ family response regulator